MPSTIFNCVYSSVKGGLEQMFINYALVLSKKYIVICIVPEDFKYFDELTSNNLKFEIIKIRNFYDISAAAHFIKLHKKYYNAPKHYIYINQQQPIPHYSQ